MRVFIQTVLISGAMAAMAVSPAEARSPWVSTGPPGASITALAAWPSDASILFAGTAGNGLYLSVDGGTTWQANNNGIAGLAISSLSAGSVGESVVLAGTPTGLFETTDSGASWARLSNGISGSVVDAVAIGGEAIYASAATAFLDGSIAAGDVFVSTDGGGTFTSTGLSSLTAGSRILALAADDQESTDVYAAPRGLGIFKRKGTSSWEPSSTGIPSSAIVNTISIDPITPNHVMAGTDAGLYASLDGGSHWSPAGVGLGSSPVNAIARSGSSEQTLYAAAGPGQSGFYKSSDGGSHWMPLPTGFGAVAVTAALQPGGASGIIFAGSGGAGLARSTDGGATWANLAAGLPLARVSCLASNPLQPATLLAGIDAGIFVSHDGGVTWIASSSGLSLADATTAPISALAADPGNDSTFYAGMALCASSGCSGGVFKTTDGGGSWARVIAGPAGGVIALAVDPLSSSNVYAGTRLCSNQLACTGSLWRSTDSGGSWQDLDPTAAAIRVPVTSIFIDRRNGLAIELATYGRGVLRSTDGGAGWEATNSGLSGILVGDLIADSTSTGLFAGTNKGVFHSGDAMSWSSSGTGLPSGAVNVMTFAPGSTSEIFAGTQGSGLWFSGDAGSHWLPAVSNGSGRYISSIVFSSDAVGLRAGTETGVYRFAPLSVGPVPVTIPIPIGGR